MPRRQYNDDDDLEPKEEGDFEAVDEEHEEDVEYHGDGKAGGKQTRSDFVDYLVEDDEEVPQLIFPENPTVWKRFKFFLGRIE